MRMYEIIKDKRDGLTLTPEEIGFVVSGYVGGVIPDYQVSALLMAIYFQGMDENETAWLTDAMAMSGDLVDLSPIPGIKVDKHSTGGVGDKTTLVVAPIVAACGVPVAKMSGRGLGHTGGTIDKLEAIPGFCTTMETGWFYEIVRKVGLSIIGQSANIAPADKMLYALRDVTGTVDNLSLIASSIMSKKIAAGANAILLDVKTGNGAFMKTLEDSIGLAQCMVSIGEKVGRHTIALVTDMDMPLGYAIGNALEVIEAVATLRGQGPADLTEVSLELASNMLFLAEQGELEYCRFLAQQALDSGRALEKFKAMVVAQGGDVSVIEDPSRFAVAPLIQEVKIQRSGYMTAIQTEKCGIASMILGAGRQNKEDEIDPSAGIVLKKKIGDWVEAGEVVAYLHTAKAAALAEASALLLQALTVGSFKVPSPDLIQARVSMDGVERNFKRNVIVP